MPRSSLPKRGEVKAQSILDEYYIKDPTSVDLELLILDKGAFLQEKPIKGAQGRILMKNSNAIITINSNIRDPRKKRFVLAHEFGHLICHSSMFSAFNCDVNDFVDWQGSRPEEAEANRFAAALLMPPEFFKSECDGQPFSLELISGLADRFQTTFMSTSIRFAEHGSYPCCVIYSVDKIIQWVAFSSDFPRMDYPIEYKRFNDPIPIDSVAHDIFETGEGAEEIFEIDIADWFPDSYYLKYFEDMDFYEVCKHYAAFNSVLSFIFTD